MVINQYGDNDLIEKLNNRFKPHGLKIGKQDIIKTYGNKELLTQLNNRDHSLTKNEVYLINSHIQVNSVNILITHLIDIKIIISTDMFLDILTKFKRLNKSLYNNISIKTELLYKFIKELIKNPPDFKPMYKLYTSNPQKTPKVKKILIEVYEKIKLVKLLKDPKKDDFVIENRYESFTNNFLLNFIMCIKFYNKNWIINKFEMLSDETKHYGCIVIGRQGDDGLIRYLPLIKKINEDKIVFNEIEEEDVILSTSWKNTNIKEINASLYMDSRTMDYARRYYEYILYKLHGLLFPPMDVTK